MAHIHPSLNQKSITSVSLIFVRLFDAQRRLPQFLDEDPSIPVLEEDPSLVLSSRENTINGDHRKSFPHLIETTTMDPTKASKGWSRGGCRETVLGDAGLRKLWKH
ncbi:unnamed protein product [Cuscuta campestris]|uniref:Uncharacterized protein n=1 Tax=Cuscuta campestris TaxID=132261 RepID=A0A484NNV4_9ASTE|nr:unnamed protein product [Cuscuta campestris]